MAAWRQKLKDTHLPFTKSKRSSSPQVDQPSDISTASTVSQSPTKPHRDDTVIDKSYSTSTIHKPEHSSDEINQLSSRVESIQMDPITTELSNTDPVMTDDLQPTAKTQTCPGVLTVKVYNGANIRLPVPLKVSRPILHRLAQSGVGVDAQELSKNMNSILEQNISDENEVALAMTSSLPAMVSVPSTDLSHPVKKALIYLVLEFDNNNEQIDATSSSMKCPKFGNITSFDVSSNMNFLTVNMYARLPTVLIASETEETPSSPQKDVLIGTSRIPLKNNPVQSSGVTRLFNHEWVNVINPETKLPMGFVNITIDFKATRDAKNLKVEDFDLLKVIGKGSFGKVMQVRKKDTGKIYALKTIRKRHIISKMEVTHTLAEKFVLAQIDNPFVVPLKFAFQSTDKLYLVLSFINGGEIFYHLQKSGRFSLVRSKFYIAELLSAIESLHKLNIIYRDLKPENILLDYQGHIALCDFGLCKVNMKLEQKTNTFCGTPEYLAPELLLGQGYTRVVDFWTLGTLLYEMLSGLPPFYDEDVNKMYKKIVHDPLTFPDFFDHTTRSLIKALLNRDPTKRLGVHGTDEIKSHPFFSDIDWVKLVTKSYIPPFTPPVSDATDTSNFDAEFTNEKPMDSVVNDYLSESVQQQFGGWTYVGGADSSVRR